jgi:hypothetical protein
VCLDKACFAEKLLAAVKAKLAGEFPKPMPVWCPDKNISLPWQRGIDVEVNGKRYPGVDLRTGWKESYLLSGTNDVKKKKVLRVYFGYNKNLCISTAELITNAAYMAWQSEGNITKDSNDQKNREILSFLLDTDFSKTKKPKDATMVAIEKVLKEYNWRLQYHLKNMVYKAYKKKCRNFAAAFSEVLIKFELPSLKTIKAIDMANQMVTMGTNAYGYEWMFELANILIHTELERNGSAVVPEYHKLMDAMDTGKYPGETSGERLFLAFTDSAPKDGGYKNVPVLIGMYREAAVKLVKEHMKKEKGEGGACPDEPDDDGDIEEDEE